MKKLIAIFAVLLLTVGVASATDFSMSGSYYARGTYEKNISGTTTVDEYKMYYDHELSVDSTWQIADTTKVFARFEMHDENWADVAAATTDDNIQVQQAWGSHKFGNGGDLQVGLQSGGAWATSFQDAGSDVYRVKWTQPTGMGNIYAILQKARETAAFDDDENDYDAYILGMATKAGSLTVLPLLVYTDYQDDGAIAGSLDGSKLTFNLAITGDMGAFGFEAEGGVVSGDYDIGAATTDYTTFGIYANVWTNMDALKVGILGAFGSYDDDADAMVGHNFGDDFAAGGAMMMGDSIVWGTSGVGLDAGKLIAVYGTYTASDALSLSAYLGYAVSGYEAVAMFDDAKVWEADFTGSYAITDAVSYGFGVGYAQLEYGDATPDPDAAIKLYHKVSFSF